MAIAWEFEVQTQSESFTPRVKRTQQTLLHCLIVAESAERREFLAQQATEAGWRVTVCADAHAASAAAKRWRHALVMVDLDGPEPSSASSLRSFTESLAGDARQLLIVCGSESNPLEEIWARQLGVWLYLSGIDPTCDLTSLCQEAKRVAEKLSLPAYARTA